VAVVPELLPVPVRLKLCGLPVALSVTLTAAVRVPVAVGVKVTLIVQVPPAATLDPQELLWAKSPELVPVTAMPEIVRLALPVLERVTAWAALLVPTAWLANVRLLGEKLTVAEVATPVPVRATLWEPVPALSVTVTEALREPEAVGVKVTLMVQLPPAATLEPQLLLWAKSPGLEPPSEMPEMLSAAFPVLFTVTAFAVLVEPTA
jgi:hypothetical protein